METALELELQKLTLEFSEAEKEHTKDEWTRLLNYIEYRKQKMYVDEVMYISHDERKLRILSETEEEVERLRFALFTLNMAIRLFDCAKNSK